MAETKINTELLAKVRDKILETPKAYDQCTWGAKSDEAPCGTRACIAGWAALLSGAVSLEMLRKGDGEIQSIAQKALRLDDDEAGRLFHGMPHCCDGECSYSWPRLFGRRYHAAKTERGRARAAADYLQHIIDTGKVTD